ncbi:PilC/PilY family type IV pilus protein [Pistricoccus aurantiacus]|uniref:PilC/PilY family type IV pilus protein n=1 Tax=Pistricoccus aurantiacus TaxID=1883414 RepID=UPI00363923BD
MSSNSGFLLRALLLGCLALPVQAEEPTDGVPYVAPRSAQAEVDPRSMIVMSNDHQLFFKAYTDWSDLDGDGRIDATYKNSIEYYGYFDSAACYDYDTALEGGAFNIAKAAEADFSCPGNRHWSGNFLNWAAMTRMDILRKVLYGGKRYRDSATQTTILERAYLPYDAHSFAKLVTDGDTINKNTPFNGKQAITFCNTTGYTGTGQSKDVQEPPLLRVASGPWKNWAANERWQCVWRDEKSKGHQDRRPKKDEDGLGHKDYRVRVEVCAVNGPDCKQYAQSNYSKPMGLLHEYANSIDFGLFSGSYAKNKSGGVLRANARKFREEVDGESGVFKNVPGIVSNIDAFRIARYDYGEGKYHLFDQCEWGKTGFANGQCSNWGNPLAEMTEEALRYLSGEDDPTSNYTVRNGQDTVEENYLIGLTSPSWNASIGDNWCAAQSMVLINASETSFDADELGKLSLETGGGIDNWTNRIAEQEGLSGSYFIGNNGSGNDRLCTPKSLNDGNFAQAEGICPGAPGLAGSYNVAGLTHYARKTPLVKNRDDVSQGSSVETYAVRLSTNTPIVDLGAVKIVPACENQQSGGRCAIVDFRPLETGEKSGRFEITWEDSEFGGDYDSDLEMHFEYQLEGKELTITTDVTNKSGNMPLGVGYVLSGTSKRFNVDGSTTSDHSSGFIAHSGSDGYNGSLCDSCQAEDSPSSQRYLVSEFGSAKELKPPLYYAAKYGNGVPEVSPEAYFEVSKVDHLEDALGSVFSQVLNSGKRTGAGLGHSGSVGHKVFQTVYDNFDGWTGNLLAFKTTAAGIASTPLWDAQAQLPSADARTIITQNASGGVVFDHNQASAALSREQIAQLRARPLGDMVGSQPLAVGAPNSFYVPSGPDDTSYVDFRSDHLNRTPMVYVGANDGMLHGFDANTGVEKLAYVPGMLLDALRELTESSYEHRYYVDGSPLVLDARVNETWRSVLASGLGSGGRGIFALDVTQPDQFAESRASEIALFEYSPALERALFGEGSEHLGYIQGKPSLVQRENGKFALAFGNGYFSPSGKAVLYLVDLDGAADGVIEAKDVQRIVASSAINDNGLSSISLVDTDANGRVDTAYGGDLQGNLWRFDLAQGEVKRLFTASRGGRHSPITTGIEVGRHPKGGQMLFFGTGSRPELPLTDASRGGIGAFYAIQDALAFADTPEDIGSDALLERRLITRTFAEGNQERFDLRFFENDAPLGDHKKGWYMKFPEGERVVSEALLHGEHILFNTLIPGQGYCGAEDQGFTYELSAFDGLATSTSAFDLDGNGVLNDQDRLNGKVAVGMRSQGALFTPVIDTHLESNVENRLSVNTRARLTTRTGAPVNPFRLGRVAWRTLEN